jgi:hypothetical protein
MTPNRIGYKIPALIGATIGAVASYVYFNTNALETMAAEADGFPLWSVYEIPFTLPWAVLGAICSTVLWMIFRSIKSSGAGKTDVPPNN